MFETSEQLYHGFAESADETYDADRRLDTCRTPPQLMPGAYQKIFLPPGSGQSRFAPPSYYYLASRSGVMPSWVIDELHRTRRLNLNS
jgi:hypothetical protein